MASAGAAGAEGAEVTCACKLATTDAPGKLGQFAKDYKALNGKDAGTYSTEGYDAANILIKGINAGNDTRAKLLDFVENKVGTYAGVGKTFHFEDNGNVLPTDVFVYEFKSGKLEVLGTAAELSK